MNDRRLGHHERSGSGSRRKPSPVMFQVFLAVGVVVLLAVVLELLGAG